jgi:two-component system OmpR family response regulator
MKKHLLLVEDDENFGSLLANYLRLSGYEVTWRINGTAGYSEAVKTNFDLCVLDVMMPHLDGFSLAKKLREKKVKSPILFLTAKNSKTDMLEGYESGAEDYLVKPFDTDVLLLKIKVILKRFSEEIDTIQLSDQYELGNFKFTPMRRELEHTVNGMYKLSPKESMLLELLCGYLNKILPREVALEKIWGESTYFTKRSMDVYITKLRKYLAADTNISIDTFHQIGFQLRIENKKV